MTTVSVRVSDKVKQEIEKFAKDEKLEQTSEAARKLLAIGIEEWKKEKALDLLEKGKVTFMKAAEIAELPVWEFSELVKDSGIVWMKDIEAVKEDIKRALKA